MASLWEAVLEKDEELFLWLNARLNELDLPVLDAFLRFANEMGAEWILLPLATAIIVLTPGTASRIRRLIDFGLAMGTVAVIVRLLRISFPRARPQRVFEDLVASGEVHVALGEIAKKFSFPSGHTAMAFGLATLFTIWAYRTGAPWKGRLTFCVMFLLAIGTGLARIYTAVHFPLDVVAGMTAGIVGPLLIASLTKRWRRRRDAKAGLEPVQEEAA